MGDAPEVSAPAAWRGLLEALAAAGEVVTGPLGARDERERAEGFRHLTRVLSIASEMLLEKGDPAHPAFTRWMNPHRKMLGDNPWTVYDAAVIDPGRVYRISGTRGTSAYLGICVYGTGEDGSRRIVANLDDDEMDIAPDGSFEVRLSSPSAPSPDTVVALPLAPDATDVMVRQYFGDRDLETPATYTIGTVPDTGPPPLLTEAAVAQRLAMVGAYVRDTVEAEATLSALIGSVTPVLLRSGSHYVDAAGKPADPPVDPGVVARVMPSPAIQYSGTWFDDLDDDEVLVVEGTAPTCRYWSIQLLSRWMESGDYLHHPVFLAGRDITVGEDGRFHVVIAHNVPATGNWIATTGMRSASVAVRALKAQGLLDVQFRRERPGIQS